MALKVGDTIITTDIINKFVRDVKNKILSGANHSGNIPYASGYLCVPTEILGNIHDIPEPHIGNPGEPVTALSIYNAVVNVTRILTRVGTWNYQRYLQTDSGYNLTLDQSGKALFTNAYIRTLPRVPDSGVKSGSRITVSSINDLMTACFNAWQNTSKHHNYKRDNYCHSSCHNSCHSSCHNESSCHSSSGGGCHYDCYGNDHGGWNHPCHTDDSSRCRWGSDGAY